MVLTYNKSINTYINDYTDFKKSIVFIMYNYFFIIIVSLICLLTSVDGDY